MNSNLTRSSSAPVGIRTGDVGPATIIPDTTTIPEPVAAQRLLPPTDKKLQLAASSARPGRLRSAHSFAFYGHSIMHFHAYLKGIAIDVPASVHEIEVPVTPMQPRAPACLSKLKASATADFVTSPAKTQIRKKNSAPPLSRPNSPELIFYFEPERAIIPPVPKLETGSCERKQCVAPTGKSAAVIRSKETALHKLIGHAPGRQLLADPLVVLTESQPARPLSDMFDEPLFGLFRQCFPDGEINLKEFGQLTSAHAMELTRSLKFSVIFGQLNPNKMDDLNALLKIPHMKKFIYRNPVAITLRFNGLTIVAMRKLRVQDRIISGELTFAKINSIDELESAGRENEFSCYWR